VHDGAVATDRLSFDHTEPSLNTNNMSRVPLHQAAAVRLVQAKHHVCTRARTNFHRDGVYRV
jgi:hypothetical protein